LKPRLIATVAAAKAKVVQEGLLPFSWVVTDWITVVRCRFSVSG